jgi:hypothetical protein
MKTISLFRTNLLAPPARFLQMITLGGLLLATWTATAASLPLLEGWAQGFYEGTGQDATGSFKIEARVVAQGNGVYKVLVRQFQAPDKIVRGELRGRKGVGPSDLTFLGKVGEPDWKAACSVTERAITGNCGPGGTFQLKLVEKKSPALGKLPPGGAIVLFEGRPFTEMVRGNGGKWYLADMNQDGWSVWEVPLTTVSAHDPTNWPTPAQLLPTGWTVSREQRRVDTMIGVADDGSLRVPSGGMSSKRTFDGSLDIHVEFMNPLMPTEHSQGRGNSGVYLPNGDEIQVLDSFGETTYLGGGCGGLYPYKDPDTMEVIDSVKGPENKFTLASYPPLTWQTYDIEYRVTLQDGKLVGKPRVTVFHNGLKIHDQAALRADARKGGLHFQDHGNPVRYRNIWVLPVSAR